MVGVRGLLARVGKLEASRRGPRSPFELAYGSLEAFETSVQSDVDAGRLDPTDMPDVLAAIRRWHNDGAWASGRSGRSGWGPLI